MTSRTRAFLAAGVAAATVLTLVSVGALRRTPRRFGSTDSRNQLIAFNLTEAERWLRSRQSIPQEIATLGGMTRLLGLVYDRDGHQVILIGRVESARAVIDLDSLVVAMRAVMIWQQWPLVSIDPTVETAATGQQAVRLEGGIADSRFGQDFLLADVRLKRLGLGLETSDGLERISYFRLRVAQALRETRRSEGRSRFWFYAIDPGLEQRDDVFLIRRLALGVRAETRSLSGRDPAADPSADEFARAVTDSFTDLCREFADLDRLQSLYEMVAVSRGMQMIPEAVSDYWLKQYAVAVTPTPRTFAVVGREERVDSPAGPRYLEVRSGIQFRALTVRLLDGDVTALKEAVLLSRPSPRRLVWFVPIGTEEPHVGDSGNKAVEAVDAGSSLDWRVGRDAEEAARRKQMLQKNIAEIDNYIKQVRPEFLKPLPMQEGAYHSDDGGITNYRNGSDLEKSSRSTGQYHSNDAGLTNYRNGSNLEMASQSTGQYHSNDGGRTHYLNGSSLENAGKSQGMYHSDDGGLTFKLNNTARTDNSPSGGFLCVTASCVGQKQATSDGMKADPYYRADLNPYSFHRFVDAGYTVSRDGKVVGSGYGDVKLLGDGAYAAKEWNGPGYEIHDASGKSISRPFAAVQPIGETGYFAVPNEGGLGMTTVYDSHMRPVRTLPSTDLNSYLQGVDFANETKSHYAEPTNQQKVGGIKVDIKINEADFQDTRRKK